MCAKNIIATIILKRYARLKTPRLRMHTSLCIRICYKITLERENLEESRIKRDAASPVHARFKTLAAYIYVTVMSQTSVIRSSSFHRECLISSLRETPRLRFCCATFPRSSVLPCILMHRARNDRVTKLLISKFPNPSRIGSSHVYMCARARDRTTRRIEIRLTRTRSSAFFRPQLQRSPPLYPICRFRDRNGICFHRHSGGVPKFSLSLRSDTSLVVGIGNRFTLARSCASRWWNPPVSARSPRRMCAVDHAEYQKGPGSRRGAVNFQNFTSDVYADIPAAR